MVVYDPSPLALAVLKRGEILKADESPLAMLRRVAKYIASEESAYFGTSSLERQYFEKNLLEELVSTRVVPSTPILTNAGRGENMPLSACTVPPISLRADYRSIKSAVDKYHEDGMGTGFDFNEVANPVAMLLFLNRVAKEGLENGRQKRPVGNMGIINIDHPQALHFATAKERYSDTDWKFNLSVDFGDVYMRALLSGTEYVVNGQKRDPLLEFERLCNAAWSCADPGAIFLERMRKRSPLGQELRYVSTAPCGEVGLAQGETCQFMYLNLREFLGFSGLDYQKLESTVRLTVRALDAVLQSSIGRFSHPVNKHVMGLSRKIGIGVCGYSDMLLGLDKEYGSEESLKILGDVLSFINFISKNASVDLARNRGSFGGFLLSSYATGTFLHDKYGCFPTSTVSKKDWEALDERISKEGLRHSTTVILPPTGRSAIVFDTSQQIEPLFSLSGMTPYARAHLVKRASNGTQLVTGDQLRMALGRDFRLQRLYRTAIEIPVSEHMATVEIAQRYTDEGISKTINLPSTATPADVYDIYLDAFQRNLNGITIYRDGSKDQPVNLQ